MKYNKQTILPILLVAVGLLQTIGYVGDSKTIKGIGAVTAASPLPIVFTKIKDLETFSSHFEIEVETVTGKHLHIKLTPKLYSQLTGPYNRRNMYGAAIAYGPLLPDTLRNSVVGYGLCKAGILARELGIEEEVSSATIHVYNNAGGMNQHWDLKTTCL